MGYVFKRRDNNIYNKIFGNNGYFKQLNDRTIKEIIKPGFNGMKKTIHPLL